ncbi:MAG: bifunctional UDP-sugar hydrolase/5'-nucleotidase [Tidjanibacter sp.]|nr:bifunctional UDP-sugar hydrolase/5'-nucleotidase [Tidjanibacter sp.]
MRKTGLLLLAAATVLTVSLTACRSHADADVIIISTGDIHSRLDRIPQLASLVEGYRSQDTATVFLVDAGDRWTGDPFVDLAPRRGYPIIEQMNSLGYDVATLGNHEFDNGLDTLQARMDDAHFPIVLANISTGRTSLRPFKPYVLLKAGGARVAFIGLVTNYAGGHPDGDDAIFEGLTFSSPEQVASRYYGLRRKADAVVVLSHLGLDRDTTVLVESMPWADVVVSSHTHETYAGVKNGVAVVQGKNKLGAVGITTLRIRDGRVVDRQIKYVELPACGDPKFEADIEKYNNNPYLLETVGKLDAAATKDQLGAMLAQVGRRAASTDFGFYHRGGTRLEVLDKGSVSRAKIYELDPFASRYVVTTMTLDELKTLIINKFNDKTNAKESHRIDLYPAGLDYTILTDGSGDAVDVRFDVATPKELYTVALADYIYGSSTYCYPRRDKEGETALVTDLVTEAFGSAESLSPESFCGFGQASIVRAK